MFATFLKYGSLLVCRLQAVRGSKQTIPRYIVATANDTTATVNGPAIDNRDGRISRISFGQRTTASTGTSPTLQTTLQGSVDEGVSWFNVLDSGGSAVQSTAQSISSPPVAEVEDTNIEGIDQFPPLVRLSCAIGGSSTPGGTYIVSLDIDRNPEKRD